MWEQKRGVLDLRSRSPALTAVSPSSGICKRDVARQQKMGMFTSWTSTEVQNNRTLYILSEVTPKIFVKHDPEITLFHGQQIHLSNGEAQCCGRRSSGFYIGVIKLCTAATGYLVLRFLPFLERESCCKYSSKRTSPRSMSMWSLRRHPMFFCVKQMLSSRIA